MSWRSSCTDIAMLTALVLGPACRPEPGRGATLQIVTVADDADADVWIDGNYIGRVGDLGKSTGAVKLAPGKHRVEVRKSGRFPVQRTVDVDGGAPSIRIDAELLEDP